jgi:hypothetical protein
MNQKDVNNLADGLMALIKNDQPSQKNIGLYGSRLITQFITKPGIEEYLAAVNLEKKVRLWGTPGTGMQILCHGADTPKKGSPHDHGSSWALYYQVSGATEMSVYSRITGTDGQPGQAELKMTEKSELTPRNAMFFGPLVIHSTRHPSVPARWIRVTGTDLDFVTRLRFSIERKEAVIEKKN